MLEILIPILVIIATITVTMLDNYSTKTLITYRYLQKTNKEFEKKSEEFYKKRSVMDDELNPFARRFMKRFGLIKGMSYFSFVARAPIFALLYYLALIDEPLFYSVFPVMTFYFGIIFSQTIHSIIYNKRAKEFGFDLAEESKKI